MPIDNRLFGVWKLLVFKDPNGASGDRAYIVKTSKETVTQEVTAELFVQGTALPLIQNIGGGIAELDITAPLLLKAHSITDNPAPYARKFNSGAGDDLHDGYTLWCRTMQAPSGSSAGMFQGWYSADPGFVIKNAGLEVTPNGATYTIGFKGDTNFLGNEIGSGYGWQVVDPSDGVAWTYWWQAPQCPIPVASSVQNDFQPLRVATFYDVVASAQVGNNIIQGYVENLKINLTVQTKQTNVVGQQTQRPIMGIAGVDIAFSGSMIWSHRQPLGYQFPWQSMNPAGGNNPRVPIANPAIGSPGETFGGTGKYSTFSLSVGLRNGAGNTAVLPLLPYLNVDKAIFSSSSVDVSNDFVRSSFEGKGWISNPNFLLPSAQGTAGGSGVNI
jgi:hypothetical protein